MLNNRKTDHRGTSDMAGLSRLEDRADLQITIILLVSWAAITIAGYWDEWPPDLAGLYLAGHSYANGNFDLVYAAPDGFFGPSVESWTKLAAELGHPGESFFPFVYPPIWAALAAPLTQMLSPLDFFNLFYVIHITMMALSVVLTYRIIRPETPMVVWSAISCAMLFISLIATLALHHNQLQITVTFFILLAIERYSAGKSVYAGMALAIAAAIKITPALLGLIFLLDRDFRAAITTAVAGLALLALSFIVAGPQLHWIFIERVNEISEAIAVMRVNNALEAFIYQIGTFLSGTAVTSTERYPDFATPEPLWVSIPTKLAFIAGLALVVWRTWNLNLQDRLRMLPLGIILITTLCAPLAWNHHYLPVLFLLPVALVLFRPARAIVFLAAIMALTSISVFVFLAHQSTSMHLQAVVNTGLMIAVFALFYGPKIVMWKKPKTRK